MEPSIWSYAALAAAILITGAGFVTGRSLPEERRTIHRKKFAAVGMIPIILLLMFPRPFVWSLTTPWPDRPAAQTTSSSDDLTRSSTEQAQDIRRLQDEVTNLRRDLAEVNDYYGRISQLLLTAALVFCVLYPLRKREEDVEEVDKAPLGLNDDDHE